MATKIYFSLNLRVNDEMVYGNFAMLRANLQKFERFGAFLGSHAYAPRAFPSAPHTGYAPRALPSAPRTGYAPRQCEVNAVVGLPVHRATFCVRRARLNDTI